MANQHTVLTEYQCFTSEAAAAASSLRSVIVKEEVTGLTTVWQKDKHKKLAGARYAAEKDKQKKAKARKEADAARQAEKQKEHAAEVAAQEAATEAAETDKALQAGALEFQEDSKGDIFRWLKSQFDNEVDGFSLASSIACMDYNSPLELGKFVYNGVKGYYLSPGHDIMKVAKLVPKFLPFGGILEMYERKLAECPEGDLMQRVIIINDFNLKLMSFIDTWLSSAKLSSQDLIATLRQLAQEVYDASASVLPSPATLKSLSCTPRSPEMYEAFMAEHRQLRWSHMHEDEPAAAPDPAAAEPAADQRAELGELKSFTLIRRALAAGISEEMLEGAIIALIVSKSECMLT